MRLNETGTIVWLIHADLVVKERVHHQHYLEAATMRSINKSALLGNYLVNEKGEVFKITKIHDKGNWSKMSLFNFMNPIRRIELLLCSESDVKVLNRIAQLLRDDS